MSRRFSKSAMAQSPAGASTGIPATLPGSWAVIRHRCLTRSVPDPSATEHSQCLLARDGDPACRYGFGFALEVERDDLAPVDGSDARDRLGHAGLAPRRNALAPRRGVCE